MGNADLLIVINGMSIEILGPNYDSKEGAVRSAMNGYNDHWEEFAEKYRIPMPEIEDIKIYEENL